MSKKKVYFTAPIFKILNSSYNSEIYHPKNQLLILFNYLISNILD